MWEQIASGNSFASLNDLKNYEEMIAEGQQARLNLNLSIAPSTSVIELLQDSLLRSGIPARAQAIGNTLSVFARKGFPWLAVIAAVILGLIVLAVLIVSWQLFREVQQVVPQPIIIAGVVVGIILVALLAFMIARRQL